MFQFKEVVCCKWRYLGNITVSSVLESKREYVHKLKLVSMPPGAATSAKIGGSSKGPLNTWDVTQWGREKERGADGERK